MSDLELPDDLRVQFLSFLREVDGQFEIANKEGLLRFIAEHAQKHPALLSLIQVDNGAAIEHFKKTGEVLPGMRIIHTSTPEGSNVTTLEIHRGSAPTKSSKP